MTLLLVGVEVILCNLQLIERESQDLEVALNQQKSEIFCSEPTICASLTSTLPNAANVAPTTATLPGA